MVDTPATWLPQHRVVLTYVGIDLNFHDLISIGDGRYLVAWVEGGGGPVATTNGSDVVGQIFDALGNPIGAMFQLNQVFSGDNELEVALASRLGGGFVVTYVDDFSSPNAIRIEHYDINGARIAGPPTTLATLGSLTGPQIAAAADGNYLVAYQRDNGGDNIDVLGKFVSPDGTLGVEFTIHNDGESLTNPTVAALSNGNFVVAYENERGTGENDAVTFKIVTPGAPPVVSSVINVDINATTTDQDRPKVAALEDGGFVIVYSDNEAGTDDIRAAIYTDAGIVVKAAFTVNNSLAGIQDRPVVAALHDGGFVAVWNDHAANLVKGQRFDAGGNEVGAEFLAGSAGNESDITITVLDDGRFLVGFEEVAAPSGRIHGTIFDPREKTIAGTGDGDLITAFADGGTVKGKGGEDILLGSSADDTLKGGGGKDYLAGMDGSDDLKGGGKKDFFAFAFALDKKNNVDTVEDWKKGNDKLLLLDDIFIAVGGKVNKGELRFGNNAQDDNDHLIAKVKASKKQVTLYYDEDGRGGVGKVKFAKLDYKGNLDLDHKDFQVIADLDI